MPENKIAIVITTDSSGAVTGIQKVGDATEQLASKKESLISKMKTHWLGLTAAVAGVMIGIKKAWDLADMAAGFEEQREALNSLASQYYTTAGAIINSIKEASNGMISMADAADIAGKSMMKGLSPKQITDLAGAAKTLSDVTNQRVVDSFRNLSEAIAVGRERALEASVGIIDLNEKFGDQVSKMIDAEKATARYNIVMERVRDLQEKLGGSTESFNDKMEKLQVTLKDFQLTLGQGIIRASLLAIGAFHFLAAAELELAAAAAVALIPFLTITDMLGITKNAAKDLMQFAQTAHEAAKETWGKAIAFWDAGTASSDALAKAMAKPVDKAEEQRKATEEATKSLKVYSDTIKTLGAEGLKFAGDEFSSKIRDQADLISKTWGGMIEDLKAPLSSYLSQIDTVYSKQIELQTRLAIAMKDAGVGAEAIREQSVVILETEKAQSEARLGAWTQYYESVKGLHAQAIDAQKAKTLELLALEKQIRDQRQGYADLELSLKQKLMSESEKYYSTQQALETKFSAAMELSGQAKIDALTEWQRAASSAAQEVKEGDNVIISLSDSVKTALDQIANAQREITSEQESLVDARQAELEAINTWISSLESAMAKASEMTELYKTQISEIATSIANIQTDIPLKIDNRGALDAIEEIKSRIDSIPDVTIKKVVMKVEGEASPRKPFMETMKDVEGKIKSLPERAGLTISVKSQTDALSDISRTMGKSAEKLDETSRKLGAEGISRLMAQAQGFLAQHIKYAEYVDYSKALGIMGSASIVGAMQEYGSLYQSIMSLIQGSYQSGTDYVPRTGLYLLHQGEKVTPKNENRINYAPVVNVTGGGSPREIAKRVEGSLEKNVAKFMRQYKGYA